MIEAHACEQGYEIGNIAPRLKNFETTSHKIQFPNPPPNTLKAGRQNFVPEPPGKMSPTPACKYCACMQQLEATFRAAMAFNLHTVYYHDIRGVQGGISQNPLVMENLAKSPLLAEPGLPSGNRSALKAFRKFHFDRPLVRSDFKILNN